MRTFLLLVAATILPGCAVSYRAIEPSSLSYIGEHESNGLSFSYRYGVLREAGNERYARRAERQGLHAVAARVVNRSEHPAVLDLNTLVVRSGDQPLALVPPTTAADASAQSVLPYALWALLALTIQTDDDVIVIPIGLPVAAVHLAVGATANKQARRNFREESLLGRIVRPGETAYGFLFVRGAALAPLTFEYRGEPASPSALQPDPD